VKAVIEMVNKLNSNNADWLEKEVIRKVVMETVFIKDNFFIFDRLTWNNIMNKNIALKSKGKIINLYKSDRKKIKDKDEVNLELESLGLLRNYQRTSIRDSIVSFRANGKYINLLREVGLKGC
jgi:hypothetical protein